MSGSRRVDTEMTALINARHASQKDGLPLSYAFYGDKDITSDSTPLHVDDVYLVYLSFRLRMSLRDAYGMNEYVDPIKARELRDIPAVIHEINREFRLKLDASQYTVALREALAKSYFDAGLLAKTIASIIDHLLTFKRLPRFFRDQSAVRQRGMEAQIDLMGYLNDCEKVYTSAIQEIMDSLHSHQLKMATIKNLFSTDANLLVSQGKELNEIVITARLALNSIKISAPQTQEFKQGFDRIRDQYEQLYQSILSESHSSTTIKI